MRIVEALAVAVGLSVGAVSIGGASVVGEAVGGVSTARVSVAGEVIGAVSTAGTSIGGKSIGWVAAVGESGGEASAPRSDACYIAAPDGTTAVSGDRVAFSAGHTVADPVRVELTLHRPDGSVTDLGEAIPTGYGWLYSPDGRSYGWDSTAVEDGIYALSCTETGSDGTRRTGEPLTFTVDNTTRSDWPSTCLDHEPTTPADYQAAFDHRSDGWAGADGAYPIRLPDDRVVWLFGDTLAGEIDDDNALLPGWRMPNNTIQVQSGTCFTPIMGGTRERPTSFLRPDLEDLPDNVIGVWPSGGYVDDAASPAVLRIVSSAVCRVSEGWGWQLCGMTIHTLSLPDLEVLRVDPVGYDVTAPDVPNFGSRIVLDDRGPGDPMVYLYGKAGGFQAGGPADGGAFDPGLYTARVPAGDLVGGTWEYWTGGSWSTDVGSAAPMTINDTVGADDIAVGGITPREDGTWWMTGKRGWLWVFGTPVYAWTAPGPTGPWTLVGSNGEPHDLVPSDVGFDQGRLFYGGRFATDVPGATDGAPIGVFSTNGLGCSAEDTPCTPDNDVARNVMLYGPHFFTPTRS